MVSPAPAADVDAIPSLRPSAQERAVLAVLLEHRHRVVGRRELTHLAGLGGLHERRCDSVLVGVRRLLGADSLLTVRSRGWRLAESAVTRAGELLELPHG